MGSSMLESCPIDGDVMLKRRPQPACDPDVLFSANYSRGFGASVSCSSSVQRRRGTRPTDGSPFPAFPRGDNYGEDHDDDDRGKSGKANDGGGVHYFDSSSPDTSFGRRFSGLPWRARYSTIPRAIEAGMTQTATIRTIAQGGRPEVAAGISAASVARNMEGGPLLDPIQSSDRRQHPACDSDIVAPKITPATAGRPLEVRVSDAWAFVGGPVCAHVPGRSYSDAMNGVIAIVFGVVLVIGGVAAWVAIGRARARGGVVASGVNMRTAPPFLLALGVATLVWGALHLS